MRNAIKLFGIVALAAAIGLTACDGNGSGSGGVFTLTDIPPEYNGKYIYLGLYYEGLDGALLGYLLRGYEIQNNYGAITLARIADGKADIPHWTTPFVHGPASRYSGNDTLDLLIAVVNTADWFDAADNFLIRAKLAVDFSNGSATKAWGDATWQ